MSALNERSALSPHHEESLPQRHNAGISTPHRHDVLCERGKMANNHPGNIYYRLLIGEHKRAYVQEKINNSSTIVNAIRSLTPPGRFLKKQGSFWYEVGEKQALEKASQCLREGAPELRRILQPERDELSAIQEQTLNLTSPPRTTNMNTEIISCNSKVPPIVDNSSEPHHSNTERTSMLPAYSEPQIPMGHGPPQSHSVISSNIGSQTEIESGDSKNVYASFGTPYDAHVHGQKSDCISVQKGRSEEMPSLMNQLSPTTNRETNPMHTESSFDRRAMFAFLCSKAAKNSSIWSNKTLSLRSMNTSQRRLSDTSTATSWLRAFKTMEQSIGSDTFHQFQNASYQSLLSDDVSMISEEGLQQEGDGDLDGNDDRRLVADDVGIEPLPFKNLGPE